METQKSSLPALPPRLKSAVLAAADNLTAIAHSEGIELGGKNGEALPHLVTILYTIRECCIQAELAPQPFLSDQTITLKEIATALETIGQILVSDDSFELAGYNPSWYSDAALVVERAFQEIEE